MSNRSNPVVSDSRWNLPCCQMANIPGEAEVVSTANAGKITSAAGFAGKNPGVTSLGSSREKIEP